MFLSKKAVSCIKRHWLIVSYKYEKSATIVSFRYEKSFFETFPIKWESRELHEKKLESSSKNLP